MPRSFVLATMCVLLAACESLPIPLSTSDPPAHTNAVDMSCVQDCMGNNADAELCRSRCAK